MIVSRFIKQKSLLSVAVISTLSAGFVASQTKPAQANPIVFNHHASQPVELTSRSTTVAAISNSKPVRLVPQEPRSIDQTESDLIEQVTGRSQVAPAATANIPNFTPPKAVAEITRDRRTESAPTAPLVAKTLSTTDVPSDLLPAQLHKQSASFRTINPDALNPPSPDPVVRVIMSNQRKDSLIAQSSSRSADSLIRTNRSLIRSTALTPPTLIFQGVYLHQGDRSSARARLYTVYPLSPNALVGATLDLTTGNAFTDTPGNGFNVTELYFATSPRDLPNLRFVVGQLDLTSYFDRNSFAKDGATHFFNPVFQTNPALSATGISSRPAALVNFSLTDNIEAKAAVFSSSRSLSDFAIDGFAGELGIRYGNLIVRGTYASDRDSGSNTGFQEIFQINRGDRRTGLLRGDREEAYGVNAEFFIPNLKLGLFGRYGRYNNVTLGGGGDTFSAGLTFLDLIAPDDRLGLAYGRSLSNDSLRRDSGNETPDVLEAFYDFRLFSNLRVGFSIQERGSEVIAGVRVKTEFDVLPRRQAQ